MTQPKPQSIIIPVAQYVRMSTHMQQYSLANQSDAIAAYAKLHGMEVVRSYEDGGKSGVTARNRVALKQLISDIQSRDADFKFVLVYDVSRWGRFQNTDEAAYYEFLCRMGGVTVIYVAEAFGSDDSALNMMFKHMRRAMSAEYSKDLSTKVKAGQMRLLHMGYHVGGLGAFGMHRQVVAASGELRGILKTGERKAYTTDRVILVPGLPAEVALVQLIFKLYLRKGASISSVARQLEADGKTGRSGRPLSDENIGKILTNEAYIGTAMRKPRVHRLGQPIKVAERSTWARRENSYTPIIGRDDFERVRKTFAGRERRSETDLLEDIRRTYAKHGFLSGRQLTDDGGSSVQAYTSHFGSLTKAYAKVGLAGIQKGVFERRRHALFVTLAALYEFAEIMRERGCVTKIQERSLSVVVNGCWHIAFTIAHRTRLKRYETWITPRRANGVPFHFLVYLRMFAGSHTVKDCLIVPLEEQATFPYRVQEQLPPAKAGMRYDDWDPLVQLMC